MHVGKEILSLENVELFSFATRFDTNSNWMFSILRTILVRARVTRWTGRNFPVLSKKLLEEKKLHLNFELK